MVLAPFRAGPCRQWDFSSARAAWTSGLGKERAALSLIGSSSCPPTGSPAQSTWAPPPEKGCLPPPIRPGLPLSSIRLETQDLTAQTGPPYLPQQPGDPDQPLAHPWHRHLSSPPELGNPVSLSRLGHLWVPLGLWLLVSPIRLGTHLSPHQSSLANPYRSFIHPCKELHPLYREGN